MENRPYDTPGGATERERIKDQAADTANTITDRAQQAGEKASEIAQQAAGKVKQVADDLRSKDPSEIVSDARDKAAEVGAATADRVDSAMTATGEQLSSLAHTVREKAPEGKAGEVATKAADALERSGEYLQTADLPMVRSDLERIIREHPIESLLVGLGVGYLLARATRR
jgi:ElaB/YqjD/DUF883 family membrane-anchored ribosome-binding protein